MLGHGDGGIGFERFGAAPDLHHARNAALDELQRRHHLGDALPAQVLKIARFEDAQHVIADILRERFVLFVPDVRGKRIRGFLDDLSRIQDLLGRPLGAVDYRVELTCRTRSPFAEGAGGKVAISCLVWLIAR